MKLKQLFPICLALACGSYEEPQEIGQTEQEMTAKSSQFNGIRYGHLFGGTPCPYISSAGQECYVPSTKHIWIWITDSLPAINKNLWQGAFANAIAIISNSGQAAGFDFSFTNDPNSSSLTLGLYFNLAIGGPADQVTSYYYVDSPLTSTHLTESYAGDWYSRTYSDMYLDVAKFNANNCSGTCSSLLATQIAGAALINLMGLGYQTVDTTSLSSRKVTIAQKTKAMTATQLCMASSFNALNPSTWAYSGTCN